MKKRDKHKQGKLEKNATKRALYEKARKRKMITKKHSERKATAVRQTD